MQFVKPSTKALRNKNGRLCNTSTLRCTKWSTSRSRAATTKALWSIRDARQVEKLTTTEVVNNTSKAEAQCGKRCGRRI